MEWEDLVQPIVFQQTHEGRIFRGNSWFEKFTGWSVDQWSVEGSFWDKVHECDVESVSAHLQRSAASDDPCTLTYRIRLPKDQGAPTWVQETRRRMPPKIPGGSTEGCIVAWEDCSDDALIAHRLTHAWWSSSLASLTPGAAHDLNNHFSSILIQSENYLRRLSPGHQHYEGMKNIREAVDKSISLVRKLVAIHFARAGHTQFLELNGFLAQQMEFLRQAFPRRALFSLQLQEKALHLKLDTTLFHRILIGLIRNSVEAIPIMGQGTVKISTSRGSQGSLGDTEVREWVRIEIADTGRGIPTELRPRLFKPGFSTKPPGEGSGTSLSEARRLIAEWGGSLSYRPSEEGSGSIFLIELPMADLERGAADHPPERPRIMVTGPEDRLGDVAASLRESGLEVVATRAWAVELIQTETRPFDLVCLLQGSTVEQAQAIASSVQDRRWMTRLIAEPQTSPDAPALSETVLRDLLPEPQEIRRIWKTLGRQPATDEPSPSS
ncbi:MAG: PAS domain-containing sensor histidine kinase [Verrucomicrobia bacterium]|nr:PAS domain-containing sensor histidine kinase [Verrucomicrobiota bacterium]